MTSTLPDPAAASSTEPLPRPGEAAVVIPKPLSQDQLIYRFASSKSKLHTQLTAADWDEFEKLYHPTPAQNSGKRRRGRPAKIRLIDPYRDGMSKEALSWKDLSPTELIAWFESWRGIAQAIYKGSRRAQDEVGPWVDAVATRSKGGRRQKVTDADIAFAIAAEAEYRGLHSAMGRPVTPRTATIKKRARYIAKEVSRQRKHHLVSQVGK